MAGRDELAQLEAERDRLESMIAYHNGPFYRVPPVRAPAWFVLAAIAITCGIGILIVAGISAGQISAWGLLFLVVGLSLLAYISFEGVRLTDTPAGEPETHQRLADCEARIKKLKEGRP
jgi:hypothetical protein